MKFKNKQFYTFQRHNSFLFVCFCYCFGLGFFLEYFLAAQAKTTKTKWNNCAKSELEMFWFFLFKYIIEFYLAPKLF